VQSLTGQQSSRAKCLLFALDPTSQRVQPKSEFRVGRPVLNQSRLSGAIAFTNRCFSSTRNLHSKIQLSNNWVELLFGIAEMETKPAFTEFSFRLHSTLMSNYADLTRGHDGNLLSLYSRKPSSTSRL